ncbi:RHS repeat-associated core domain-containing protein [Paludibacterium yongneupense]|uniref:RHS repeat-associated core domain-containing protein n=1 Tax=Paludibacterium yongneupense TaxID=400061 RepID=UPI001C051516|nr:RHS repeat-associated core domain-containing protein [Paludibacterium yongneupense]
MNSVLLTLSGGPSALATIPGFNGESQDPAGTHYHLGNGYRAYSLTLMRFTCPDSLSPFGTGSINPYAYCDGDPVNLADPSGHMSAQAGVGIALGALGIVLAIFTAGASIAAAGGVMAAIAAASLEETDPQAAAALGWASLATGIVSAGAGITSYKGGAGAKRHNDGLGMNRRMSVTRDADDSRHVTAQQPSADVIKFNTSRGGPVEHAAATSLGAGTPETPPRRSPASTSRRKAPGPP